MLHSIHKKQLIKVDRAQIWNFISNPANLAIITPPKMNFKVLSDLGNKKMHAGQIIEYKVSPLLGINLHWVTEITHVKEQEYFVDEQRFGPYSFWHHQHQLLETPLGLEMHDEIHYKIPFGFIGNALNALLVSRELDNIFEYRRQKIDQIFHLKM